MRPLTAVAVLVLCLLAATAGAQQLPPVDGRAVDKVMLATMKAWQIPGAAVAIVRNDRLVYVQGYGTKDLASGEPVTPDTLFQVASTTKAFTSTALAMLATDGKLSFDDPVRKHVPYFRLADLCANEQVTVRDIVSHRTGLQRHDELWDNTPLTREELIRSFGELALTKPFRTSYQYQNAMFVAAGEVVASASGQPWDDFVRERIFKPLRMTRTTLSDDAWAVAADRATGYRYDWRTGRVAVQPPIATHTLGAGGAIKSTARDMANWVRFHLANGAFELRQLVDSTHLDETKTPQTVIRVEKTTRDNNPESNVMAYGMGWVVQDYRGELLVSHAGALNGFRTHVDLLPERNSGFVVMTNLGRSMSLLAFRNALADLLSGKPARDWNAYYLMLDRRGDEKAAQQREERLAKRIAGTSPTRPLQSYAGEYRNPAYGSALITPVGDKLVLQWKQITVPLTHFHYDVFLAESEADFLDEQIEFGLDSRKEVKTLTLFGQTFTKKE